MAIQRNQRTESRRSLRSKPRAAGSAKEEPLKLITLEGDLSVLRTPSEKAPEVRLDEDAGEKTIGHRVPVPSSGVARGYRNIVIGLAATDILCVVTALMLAWLIRFHTPPRSAAYTAALLIGAALWIPVFHAYGLYAVRHLSAAEEFRRTIGAASIGALLIVLTSYWTKSDLSREWVAMTWALALVLELVTRRLWRARVWRLRTDGRLAQRTLVVGANPEAARLASALRAPRLGFRPLGCVATSEGQAAVSDLEVLGGIEDLVDLISRHAIDCVFVASTAVTSAETLSIVQASRQSGVEVRISANLPQILASRLSVQPVGADVMAISLKSVKLTGSQTVIKRAFDLIAASGALLVFMPFLLGIAAAIKLSSKGSVLFRQRRVTKGGHSFMVYKFRTMYEDSDALLGDRDVSSPFFKVEDDPRLTPVGRVIRKLSLDELPQLINVVKGEMSLVGPRPLPVDQVAANFELLAPRHEVPAGVTGWWQVNGRSDVPPEEALRLDLFYIENWSLSLDLYILLKTVGVILARRGAY